MADRKRIVFVSHQADRTGAPIVLLHLLRWLKKSSDFELLIILQHGGELENEFHKVGRTLIWNFSAANNIWRNRWDRIAGSAKKHQNAVLNEVKKFAPNLIYANTIVTAPLGIKIKQLIGCHLICHVHELGIVIDEFFGTVNFTGLTKEIDFFVAASEAVSINLQHNHQVPLNSIQVVHEFVEEIHSDLFEDIRYNIRKKLGIPDNALVIAGAGSIDWRKGPDLFIQVTLHVSAASDAKVQFIWIGGKLLSSDGRKVEHDVKHAGVSGSVRFLGIQTNPYDYLSAIDIFLLTSREDPYPLVCLEAASLGKPIICFANAGGMPEFVEKDCGFIIPYLRADLMAEAVLELQASETLRAALGRNAALKMRQRHTIALAGTTIAEIIKIKSI